MRADKMSVYMMAVEKKIVYLAEHKMAADKMHINMPIDKIFKTYKMS